MSAQNAIDEAEKRARLAREEHEKSTKELDEQLAEARVCNFSGVCCFVSSQILRNSFTRCPPRNKI